MSRSPRTLARLALHRLGLGARPGDIEAVAPDPPARVMEELAGPVPGPEGLPPLADLFMHKFRWEQHLAATTQAAAPTGPAGPMSQAAAMSEAAASLPPGVFRLPEGRFYDAEVEARLALLRQPLIGLPERLVWFWSNHFAVAAGKGGWQRITVGAFEREVVRPHALGRFADMLQASTRHYAMLSYLDNENSVGPNSPLGRGRRGLNENLAREILELHTLGADGGYGQRDVEGLARILTGWTIGDPRKGESPGAFVFNARAHEPGAHRVLGKVYPEDGEAQGRAALDDLARHPATARFIAFKLARHFVADAPPAPLVRRLATVFRDTDGDLRAVARALAAADETWTLPAAKLRTPQEFLGAALRATAAPVSARTYSQVLRGLANRLWDVPGPNGFPDVAAAWLSPANFRARFEAAFEVARRDRTGLAPDALAEAVLGDAVSGDTLAGIRAVPTRAEAVAVLLLSSEFQRR